MSDQDKTREELISELEELRRREEQWRSILVNTPVFVCLVDRAGTIQYLNRTVPGITMEDAIGRSTYDFIEPAHWEIARECIERVFDTGQPACYELISAGPNGSRSWYETSVGPVKAGDQVVAVTLIATDITEKKRAEEALRLSEEHHRVLKETMLQGVVHHDAEGTIIAMNPAAEHILGKSREQFLGSSSTGEEHDSIREDGSLFPGVEHPAMVALRTGQPVTGVVMGVFNPKVGDYRWISIDAVPLFRSREKRPYQVYAVFEDITERKQAEEALREREARLLEAQEVASLGFYVLDIATGRFSTSSVLDGLFGISADYERSVDGWANLVFPDERQEMLDYFLKEVAQEKNLFDREYRIVRYGDKQVRWVHGLGRLQFNADGQPVSMLGTIQDITDRKRAEEALQHAHDELERRVEERTAELTRANEDLRREIEERKRSEAALLEAKLFSDTIIESIPGPFYVVDRHGSYVRWNKAQQEIAGVSPETMLQTNCLTTIHEDDRDTIAEPLAEFNKERAKKHVELEARILTKAGVRDFSLTGKRMDIGETFFIVGCGTDITERKQAEAALRISEEKHRGVVDACPDAVVMSDLNGQVQFASRQAWGLLGLVDSDELVGRTVFDYVVEDDRKRLAGNMSNLVELGVRRNTEYTLVRQDGARVPVEASSVVIRDAAGQPKAVMAVIRDITERKHAEEALRQSHDELRAIYESIGDGLLVADRETLRIVRANAAICSMLAYSEEELLSMSIPALHPKETLTSIVDPIQAGIVGHLPGKANAPMLRKHGSVFYADITGDTFTYQGRPCSLGVFRDVTERREAQAALERERRTLKHMLEASDHERQLIAYDIHDGLAQELAGAMMQFQIYAHAQQANPKDAAKAFDTGMAMLQLSHVEARRLISGVRPPILDESGVMAAIAHLVYDPAFDQGPKIDFRNKVTFKRLAPILENVIYRIVQEGLTNARNHSKSKKIRVSLRQRGDRLRIEIRDWGVGFDLQTVKENHFGLEGIRERSRLLGGDCTIKSKLGKGTAIVVELPVVERESEQ